MTYPDGHKVSGAWENVYSWKIFMGHGKVEWTDGRVWHGPWKDGQPVSYRTKLSNLRYELTSVSQCFKGKGNWRTQTAIQLKATSSMAIALSARKSIDTITMNTKNAENTSIYTTTCTIRMRLITTVVRILDIRDQTCNKNCCCGSIFEPWKKNNRTLAFSSYLMHCNGTIVQHLRVKKWNLTSGWPALARRS